MSKTLSIKAGISLPIAPQVRAVSAAATGTGNVTANLPTGQLVNDILLLVVESANQAIAVTAGYQQMGPQNGLGTAAASGATRLAVFWKRSVGAGESAPVVTDPGNRAYCTMLAISGCVTSGTPFQWKGNNVKKTTSTSMSILGSETTIDNMLVLAFVSNGVSSASAQYSSIANADLSSVTEQFDGASTDGVGGGLGVFSGVKTTAGVYGTWTATLANTSVEVFLSIAMIPSTKSQPGSSPSPVETYTYLTAGAAGDVFYPPTFGKLANYFANGGGGRGGAGINITAAGGGGGGGGAHAEGWFKLDEYTFPWLLTVGTGGIGGATKGASTNSNIKNNNGSGLTLVTAGAGVAGVDASSNSGGNGGGGGSISPLSVTANNTQGLGGAGAGTTTGATTGATGNPGDWGGGSGAGGKNAADTSPGGDSYKGAGGGGAGATTGNGGNGGAGGNRQTAASAPGGSATETSNWRYGAGGGAGSGSGAGGNGAQPGGGGGGGSSASGNNGGNGADGSIVLDIYS